MFTFPKTYAQYIEAEMADLRSDLAEATTYGQYNRVMENLEVERSHLNSSLRGHRSSLARAEKSLTYWTGQDDIMEGSYHSTVALISSHIAAVVAARDEVTEGLRAIKASRRAFEKFLREGDFN
jgi:hypothetical protein